MAIASDRGLSDALTSLVSQAAAAILAVRAGSLNARAKPDQSPVTAADEASEAIILEGLTRLLPGIPVISEESAKPAGESERSDFVLVDPLDGTRELVAGRDEFTINVALVRDGIPVIGLVSAPALGTIWRTANGGAERIRLAPGAPASAASDRTMIRTRPTPPSGMIAAVSRSHLDPATDAFLAAFDGVQRLVSGSAIKFCRVAEGEADIYPRLATTSLWDVAAGHAVLAAAGGTVTRPDRSPLTYRPETDGLLIPSFIAWGDRSAAFRG